LLRSNPFSEGGQALVHALGDAGGIHGRKRTGTGGAGAGSSFEDSLGKQGRQHALPRLGRGGTGEMPPLLAALPDSPPKRPEAARLESFGDGSWERDVSSPG